jgi:hypothetical protein
MLLPFRELHEDHRLPIGGSYVTKPLGNFLNLRTTRASTLPSVAGCDTSCLRPRWRYVEVTWDAWRHVRTEHFDLADSLQDVVLTIETPTYREPDPVLGRERLFRRGGPDGWIRVVVEFARHCDRLVTAFPQAGDPRRRGRR